MKPFIKLLSNNFNYNILQFNKVKLTVHEYHCILSYETPFIVLYKPMSL